MRRVHPPLVALALAACSASAPTPPPTDGGSQPPVGTPPPRTDRPMVAGERELIADARWPILAVPVAFASDGRRWLGAVDHDLVLFDDGRETARYESRGAGIDRLVALPDGGWVAGARVLAPDGTVRFDGYSWGNRYGRFATAKASAISPDGTVAIIAASDSPSTCLRDKDCGNAGGYAGALVRLDLTATPPRERALFEHDERHDFVVAASNDVVAAIDRDSLSVWPAKGDDAPQTAKIAGDTPKTLDFVTGGDLVGTRWIDPERGELVVLDEGAGFATRVTTAIEGAIQSVAIHPTRDEIAVGTVWYRARERVEIDEKRTEIHRTDGTLVARLGVAAIPSSVAWTPSGDALLVAFTSNDPAQREVVRYRIE
jgi:PAS domain-containing protein